MMSIWSTVIRCIVQVSVDTVHELWLATTEGITFASVWIVTDERAGVPAICVGMKIDLFAILTEFQKTLA